MTELPTLLPRVEDLATLPTSQLLHIKKLLEKYFSSSGTNIAIHNILKSQSAGDFRKRTKSALISQVLHVVTIENVSRVSGTIKADVENMFDDWIPFDIAFGGKELIIAFLLFATEVGGQLAVDSFGSGGKFKLRNKKVKDGVSGRADDVVGYLDNTTKNWIVSNIDAGRSKNMTATEIVKAIRGGVEDVMTKRADLITENEAMTAMTSIELETYKRSGIKYISWKVDVSEGTCNACLGNEYAGKLEIGGEFPSGHIHPPAHLYCRCFLIPDIPKDFNNKIWTGK